MVMEFHRIIPYFKGNFLVMSLIETKSEISQSIVLYLSTVSIDPGVPFLSLATSA